MKKVIKNGLFASFISLTLFACKDDDDSSVNPDGSNINPNEGELITTVELTFSDSTSNPLDTFYFRDIDGVGGNPPIIDTLHLIENSFYLVAIRFLDESDPNDVEDITAEIKVEDDEHLVCYTSSTADLVVSITDSDGNYPIGLKSEWTTVNPTTGSIQISLKHQPGVKDGSCSPGETDVEVNFPLIIR